MAGYRINVTELFRNHKGEYYLEELVKKIPELEGARVKKCIFFLDGLRFRKKNIRVVRSPDFPSLSSC